MIEARGLSKRYGDKVAVDDLSFTVQPGRVTGFLGPNGAGKTTTMRMILGLDRPTGGSVTVHGKPFAELYSPMREVGALLDATAVHGGRSAYKHLLCLAQTNDIPRSRVDEVIGIVGLEDVAGKRSKGFSLGMSQRLGIAAALLGDPDVLMFDEHGAGAIIRHTAGAITAILGVIFLIPALAQALPNSWFADVVRWLPGGEALSPIARSAPPISEHLFSAWGEFAVFSGYAAVLLALGAWLFIRRDA
jgi:ABC-type branched-subunit amino acid transport system ATPase component